jgi:hypothetical protein
MARETASVVLYAVDLEELREWVGSGDEQRLREALAVLREDDDSDWEPQELQLLERLLRRLVMDGKLYDGLPPEERYYLTQLLVDLFDEYVDQEALSEDLPHDALVQLHDSLPRGEEAARMLRWLVRGREMEGDGVLWEQGPVEEQLSFFGYLRRDEAAAFVTALDQAAARLKKRPSGLFKQVRNAAEECARAELDLLSFVG